MNIQCTRFVVLLMFTILLFSSTSIAGPNAYIGLYADELREHCSVSVPLPFMTFETYVWVLPNDNGMNEVTFAISDHEDIEISGTTPSYSASGVVCEIVEDCTVIFGDCQHEWIWVYKCTMIPMAAIVGQINVINPLSGVPSVIECTGGNTTPLIVLNNLFINQPCTLSSESRSWGTIKSLFRN